MTIPTRPGDRVEFSRRGAPACAPGRAPRDKSRADTRGPAARLVPPLHGPAVSGASETPWPRLIALLVLIVLLAIAGSASAQGDFELPPGVTWDDVNRIARKMYRDVCEGIPLDECESVACRQWREEIARQLGAGRSEDEIFDYFIERYGADVAALPRSTGDRLLAFAVPLGLALLIGALGVVQIRRLRQRGLQPGQPVRRTGRGVMHTRPVPEDFDPALLERLQRDLERLGS
jgi:cytochrome c-type biogenesis protein CcmH